MPAPAVYAAQAPVVEYLAPAPSVFQAPTPVVEYLAPAPDLSDAPATGAEFIAPLAHTQFFSLTSVFSCRDTLPDCHWHQESKGHRDSDKFFVETPSCGRGRART